MNKEALKLALVIEEFDKNDESLPLELLKPIAATLRTLAQQEQEPVAWMNNKDFEPIRVRIMQEAYELADRNDSESYNAIKVMCGDVQRMLPPKRPWVDLSDSQIEQVYYDVAKLHRGAPMPWGQVQFGNALQALVKEKNNG